MRTQVDYYKSGASMRNGEKAHTFYIDAKNAQDALNKLERAKEIVNRRGVWVVHKNEEEIRKDNSYEYEGHTITLTKKGFKIEGVQIIKGQDIVFRLREQAENFVDRIVEAERSKEDGNN